MAGAARALPPQRPGGFHVIGPGGGGTFLQPAVSPFDPGTAVATSDMSGNYITHDGGRTWRMFNLRGGTRQFVFDPADRHVIYALGVALWKSDNDGKTWKLLLPHPDKVLGYEEASDEGESVLLNSEIAEAGSKEFPVPSLMVIDPGHRSHMYAAIGTSLYGTQDSGATWSRQDVLPQGISAMVLVPAAPGRAEKVLMGGSDGIWMATGKDPRRLLPAGPAKIGVVAMEVVGDQVLAMAWTADHRLVSAQINPEQPGTPAWTELLLPGKPESIWAIGMSDDGKTIYASFSQMAVGGEMADGIMKSDDAGAHWKVVLSKGLHGARNLKGGWIEADLESDWSEAAKGLAVAPHHPDVVYGTDMGEVYRSVDGGAEWETLYSHTAAGGGAVTSGLDVTTSWGVWFDPFSARRVLLGNTDIGLTRSEDGGKSWWSARADVPAQDRNTTYAMVFDPGVKGLVWAAMSGTHDLPRPRMWRHRSPQTFTGAVMMSTDGGLHWVAQTEGMPPAAVTDLLMDSKSPVGARVFYAAALGRGVFLSMDNGRTWKQRNEGIGGAEPFCWRLEMGPDRSVYVVVARRAERTGLTSAGGGALYRLAEGSAEWKSVPLPEGVNGPTSLIVDPRDARHLTLSAWCVPTGQYGEGGGIYESRDGGANWKALLTVDQHVSTVTRNPANADELYAAGYESSIWHSTDNGAHWRRVPGYNFKAGTKVVPDPRHPGMVYVNTFGGGLWYGSLDGTAGVEDIATPVAAVGTRKPE